MAFEKNAIAATRAADKVDRQARELMRIIEAAGGLVSSFEKAKLIRQGRAMGALAEKMLREVLEGKNPEQTREDGE